MTLAQAEERIQVNEAMETLGHTAGAAQEPMEVVKKVHARKERPSGELCDGAGLTVVSHALKLFGGESRDSMVSSKVASRELPCGDEVCIRRSHTDTSSYHLFISSTRDCPTQSACPSNNAFHARS
jgi:hypothetical protein